MAHDVIIAGGGVIGLSIAYHAARDGARVAILERDAPGAGASAAAAGMLAAQIEPDSDSPLYRLCTWSRSLFPAFAGTLATEVGIDIELVTGGIMELAQTDSVVAHLRSTVAWQVASGQQAIWLDAAAAAAWLPETPDLAGAMFAPADGHVHPGRLVQALAAACRRRGVEMLPGQEVCGVERDGERVVGLRTVHGRWLAGAAIIAAGAHTGALASQIGVRLPVRPVKGQILALEPASLPPGPWQQRGTAVYGGGCYVVPRRDGQVVVGATIEPGAGYDRRLTAGGLGGLLATVTRLYPSLADATLVRAWSGLRPGSPDRAPMLGPVSGHPGLFVAAGHLRNGILLAPGTGRAVAALVAGRTPEMDITAFSPDRFLE